MAGLKGERTMDDTQCNFVRCCGDGCGDGTVVYSRHPAMVHRLEEWFRGSMGTAAAAGHLIIDEHDSALHI